MKNLFIDTASSRVIVAVVNEDKVISIHNEENGHDLSTKIFSIIDSVLKDANTISDELDTIYVVNGPGSFTGVRIGVTIAKTMAWTLKKKIIALSELELLCTTKNDSDYVVALIDARRDASFAGIYDKHGDSYLTDRYIKNGDLMNLLPNDSQIQYISYDKYNSFDITTPNVDILKIINKHKNDDLISPHAINPEYLKLTEAEENKLKEIV